MIKPKFIYFDVGNIFNTYDHVFETPAKELGVTANNILSIFEKYEKEISIGQMDASDLWQKCLQELGVNGDPNYDLGSAWASDYGLIQEMHELARTLEQRYKIGILSNHYIGPFEAALQQGKIPDLKYSSVITSARVGHKKPGMEIYKIAEEKSGYRGDSILFIDDQQKNLDTAKLLGWHTFLYDSKDSDNSTAKLAEILL